MPIHPPYMANPDNCKVLSPTGHYSGASAGFVWFRGPSWHIQPGEAPNDVSLAQLSGLPMVLVHQGTTGNPQFVKKRETGLGTQTPGGLGAMRTCACMHASETCRIRCSRDPQKRGFREPPPPWLLPIGLAPRARIACIIHIRAMCPNYSAP